MGAVHMIVIGATVVRVLGGTAAAQELPRLETGIVVSAPGAALAGLGVRVGTAVTPRSMLEGGVEWMDLGRRRLFTDQVVWIYYVQGRRTIRDMDNQGSVFLTYGATGFADRTTRRGGGFELFYVPPLLPTVGIGWQSAAPGSLSLSMRIDVQSLWLVGEFGVVPRFIAGAVLRLR